jgi:hypothetical protein
MSISDLESSFEVLEISESPHSLTQTDTVHPHSNSPTITPLTPLSNIPIPIPHIMSNHSTPNHSDHEQHDDSISRLHKLPIHHARDSLLPFDGNSQEIEDFLDNYESLVHQAKITSNKDKVRSITRYVT